jgi:hypothetical protein
LSERKFLHKRDDLLQIARVEELLDRKRQSKRIYKPGRCGAELEG